MSPARRSDEAAFATAWPWMDYAKDENQKQTWLAALADEPTRQAIGMLAARQQRTVEVHYGVPVPLLTVLDGVSAEFWTFLQRPILCGLLNDGLFRGRFHVDGFDATSEGREAVFAFVQEVADADLPREIRKRYARSGL